MVRAVERRADGSHILGCDDALRVGRVGVERHQVLRSAADSQHAGTKIAEQVGEGRTGTGVHVTLDQRPLDAEADEVGGNATAGYVAAGVEPQRGVGSGEFRSSGGRVVVTASLLRSRGDRVAAAGIRWTRGG
jgi:hypothetical protein